MDSTPSESPRPMQQAPNGVTQTSRIHDFASRDIMPGREKALDGISLRAFLLGGTLGIASIMALLLALQGHQVWRVPFFLAILSTFHFLEYWVTAAYNTRYANVSAFLITNNGYAYNLAHTAALLECLITSLFFPRWQSQVSTPATITLGLVLIFIGQLTRSGAMAQAGTNFNHTVQTEKGQGHVLVQHGLYAYLRHPSYFGFFWWGLGTQVVLGNTVCFTAYAVILWKFFSSRISREEEYLVKFFGKEYEDYRQRTRVGIPLIS